MKAEDYSVRELTIEGWPVRLISYRLGEQWHAKIENVSPGATLARGSAISAEDAQKQVLETATRRLARTRRHGT